MAFPLPILSQIADAKKSTNSSSPVSRNLQHETLHLLTCKDGIYFFTLLDFLPDLMERMQKLCASSKPRPQKYLQASVLVLGTLPI